MLNRSTLVVLVITTKLNTKRKRSIAYNVW